MTFLCSWVVVTYGYLCLRYNYWTQAYRTHYIKRNDKDYVNLKLNKEHITKTQISFHYKKNCSLKYKVNVNIYNSFY